MEQQFVFVASWTKYGAPFGIYVFRQEPENGHLTLLHTYPEVNAGFVAQHPNGKYLFVVNENREIHGEGPGGVASYEINGETGALTYLSRQPTFGGQTCHLTVDPTGRFLIVMNHEWGLVVVVPILEDGKLGRVCQEIQHRGPIGPHWLQRNEHCHFVTFDPDLKHVLITDKGMDRVMVYTFDAEAGSLAPHDPPFVQVHSGKAPRHIAIHPSGRFVYVNGEADLTVTAFKYDGARGLLEEIEYHSTLAPGDPMEPNYNTAHILVRPDGKFLYVSNRIYDMISIFAIDQETGQLTPAGHVHSQGHKPRNFAFDLDCRYVYVANMEAGGIVQYTVNEETGWLSSTGHFVTAGSPSCVLFRRPGYRISGFGG